MVQKYNALSPIKDYVTRVGIQLAQIGQADRVSNALAGKTWNRRLAGVFTRCRDTDYESWVLDSLESFK
jgi:hypothetical protein